MRTEVKINLKEGFSEATIIVFEKGVNYMVLGGTLEVHDPTYKTEGMSTIIQGKENSDPNPRHNRGVVTVGAHILK